MPKAKKSHTTPTPESAPDITTDALAVFRSLADRSADALLLSDGPPHPDVELLNIAADVLDLKQKRMEAFNIAWDGWHAEASKLGQRAIDNRVARMRVVKGYQNHIVRLAHLASKQPATTPAGIYAKCHVVRNLLGSGGIVASLVADILHNPAIRAALWPSNPE